MAKEIKSVNVAPSKEEETINVWQSFGWEFKSTQEVKTQDVQTFDYQDSDGTEHYKTTFGDHYVKLTFERDPSMQNYAELVSVEKQYYAVPGPKAKPVLGTAPDVPFGFIWVILALIGLSCGGIPGIILIIWRFAACSKKESEMSNSLRADYDTRYKQWKADYDICVNKRNEILAKAKSFA